MAQRNSELPEGTDHIVNGALETGGSTGGGASATGFIGSGAEGSTGGSGGSMTSGGGQSTDLRAQLRDGASSLKDQASEKARAYAEDGKSRATTALDDLSKVVSDAAGSIDERLGSEYGEYARRAADSVANFADTLRNKQVDDLYNGARDLVRKSPAIAIGAAAVVGFTLVRLIKSGMDENSRVDVDFEPDAGMGQTGTGPLGGSQTGGGQTGTSQGV